MEKLNNKKEDSFEWINETENEKEENRNRVAYIIYI